jgi:hypothetical protein
MTATQLGAHVIKAAVERSGLNRSEVDEVFFGNVLSAKYAPSAFVHTPLTLSIATAWAKTPPANAPSPQASPPAPSARRSTRCAPHR